MIVSVTSCSRRLIVRMRVQPSHSMGSSNRALEVFHPQALMGALTLAKQTRQAFQL